MRAWLRAALAPVQGDLSGAYLFGSVLDLNAHPADVDLVLVAIDGAGEPGWRRVRTLRTAIAPAFTRAFGLPLSGMVLTPSEWREIDGTIVREREPLLGN
jgi:predicted nucleotidyltransferase